MVKIIRKLSPFSPIEIEYMESWLSDMANQGLFIDSIILWFASFRKGEPKKRRYRLVPKGYGMGIGDVSDEEKAFYAQNQWDFAFSTSGMSIFYTDNEEAEEFFTDAASFRSYTQKFVYGITLSMLAMGYLVFNIFRGGLDLAKFETPPMHLLNQTGLILAFSFILLTVLAIFIGIKLIVTYSILITKIKKGIKLRHDKPYKRVARFNNIITVLFFVSMIGFPVGMIASHNFPGTTINYAETIAYDGTHPVMFREIDENNWATVQKCIDSGEWIMDVGYTIDSYWDGLFKRIVNVDVRIDEGKQDSILYIATYYNARSESVAKRYLKEEVSYATGQYIDMDDIQIKCDGVDYAGFYSDAYGSYQYLFVLNGTQLETVMYLGEKNLKDNLQLFVDDISK